jgi:predicted NBD/HSP70 family sugar kinase
MPTITFTTSGALRKSALRQANERLVLDSIRRHPGISRAEIARMTALSSTSVTFVVNRLRKQRLVVEQKLGTGPQSAGRPPSALHIRAEAMWAIGVEISQPNSAVVLVDLLGTIRRREVIPCLGSPELFLNKLHRAIGKVAQSCASEQIVGVGVCMPGTIDKTNGRIIAAENIGWIGVDVGRLLRGHLPWPFFYENDANLAAIAEHWFPSPETDQLRYYVSVRLRTGVGTGVVVDGRTLHGVSSASAEFGHVMLYPDGRPCSCGNRGCWEQYASEPALLRCYQELAGAAKPEVSIDSAALIQLARGGDKHALQALRTTASYVALGMVNLVAALNPQAIILGEPMVAAWDLVEETIREELRKRVPPYALSDLRIVPSRLGDDAALLGAATLPLAHFFTRFDHSKDEALPNRVSIQARGA